TGRVDVYVPRSVAALFRAMPVTPRPLADLIVHLLGGDRVLVEPDRLARAAYERRTSEQGLERYPRASAGDDPAAATAAATDTRRAAIG
ncbi:MAG: hypothetical protein ACRDL5_04140, partial [Solirubrobacteraceae bacterium]